MVEQRSSALLGLTADASLLGAGDDSLPADLPQRVSGAYSRAPKGLIRAGAAASGVALGGGVVLVLLSAVELVGGSAGFAAGALVLGLVLAGTHRRWAQLADANARGLEDRRRRRLVADRERWLEAIEPYPRFEVSTTVAEDGSIEIVRVCYSPVHAARGHFRFERAIERRERHAAEEPSAVVAERAEEMRRHAALDSERAREHYQALRDARGTTLMTGEAEHEHREGVRAASGALSEQINANLREPPLEG